MHHRFFAALAAAGVLAAPAARAQQTPPAPAQQVPAPNPQQPAPNPMPQQPAAVPGTPPPLVGPIEVPPPARPPAYLPFPHLPPVPLDEGLNGWGIAQQTARARKLQARVLWIDGTANLGRVNTPEKIAALVRQIKTAGFNTIVFEIKPIIGLTLYPSRYAPRLTSWTKNGTTAVMAPEFDPLAEFLRQRDAQGGLQIVVCMNAFSEGHRDFLKGPGYDNPRWQTTLYEPLTQVRARAAGSPVFPVADRANRPARSPQELAVYTDLSRAKPAPGSLVALLDIEGDVLATIDGPSLAAVSPNLQAGAGMLVGSGAAADFLRQNARPGERLVVETVPAYMPIAQRPEQQVPLMTNPHNPEVRQRLLNMLTEVATSYPVDGIIFDDRLRYAGINADFSEATRRDFERYVGGQAVRWPDDVFRWEVAFPAMTRRVVPGPRYDDWLLFRAQTLRNWLAEAVTTVKRVRPTAMVSTYVGSWYGEYPTYGANWAADDFVAGFRFLTPSYQKTGWAGLVDWMTTGAYYPAASVNEAITLGRIPGASVEAAGQLSNRAANDQTWVYAGVMLTDYGVRVDALKSALQAAAASTQGVMVFDLSHFYVNGAPTDALWAAFAETFREPAQAPHAVPGLLAEVRGQRAARKASGAAEPPVVIYGGVPGTGF